MFWLPVLEDKEDKDIVIENGKRKKTKEESSIAKKFKPALAKARLMYRETDKDLVGIKKRMKEVKEKYPDEFEFEGTMYSTISTMQKTKISTIKLEVDILKTSTDLEMKQRKMEIDALGGSGAGGGFGGGNMKESLASVLFSGGGADSGAMPLLNAKALNGGVSDSKGFGGGNTNTPTEHVGYIEGDSTVVTDGQIIGSEPKDFLETNTGLNYEHAATNAKIRGMDIQKIMKKDQETGRYWIETKDVSTGELIQGVNKHIESLGNIDFNDREGIATDELGTNYELVFAKEENMPQEARKQWSQMGMEADLEDGDNSNIGSEPE